MISEKVLDEILPVPELEQLKADVIAELNAAGFVITNWSSGGVFNTLLMIVLRGRIELIRLLRSILNNMFITHAQGTWLELKAADFSKRRKPAGKTRGFVTVGRNAPGEAVRIPKGHVFKTERDINGDDLRFLVLQDTILQQNALSVMVPVEAEKEGARYNVPQGQISKSLIHIAGIDSVTNAAQWITREGSDLEDYESLRERTLNSWAELATFAIRDKYRNVCEAVPGVLFAKVNDLHPRGQGTIDIVVTSTAGTASEGLLDLVRAEADKIRGPYDDILVKGSTTIEQDIEMLLTIPYGAANAGIEDRAIAAVTELLRIRRGRDLNVLTHADIIFAVKTSVPELKNVKVIVPSEDVVLEDDKVIVLGNTTVTVQRV